MFYWVKVKHDHNNTQLFKLKKKKKKEQETLKRKYFGTSPLRIKRRTSHSLDKKLVLVLDGVFLLRVCENRPKPFFLVIIYPILPRKRPIILNQKFRFAADKADRIPISLEKDICLSNFFKRWNIKAKNPKLTFDKQMNWIQWTKLTKNSAFI